ncbi:response regulator [Paenibacillus gansuensis]|uniref:Response regulator n=1 Tax=Paenibacillus gansuensis TaxID=306542 RepID=A0ABW5PBR1_9BACL
MDKHKILIVDDEAIFRKGLRKMIESSGGPWEVAGEAVDGYEALERLEALRPDVMITDIRMPRMDGIQLQQIVKERFPELLVIVLSGYDEFTYVQHSLRHGVKDYLMKPVEREELFRTLSELEKELSRAEAGKSATADSAPGSDPEIRKHVSEHLITGLLRGYVSEKELELLSKIGVQFNDPRFACLIIKLDKDMMDRDRYRKADPSLFQLYIQQIVQEILNQRTNGFCFVFSDSEVVALVNLKEGEAAAQSLSDISETIRIRMISLSNLTVTIAQGTIVDGIRDIPRSFNEAKIALLYRLLLGGDQVLTYEQTAMAQTIPAEVKPWSWDDLESSIHDGRQEETERRVVTVVTDLCEQSKNPETIQQQISKLLIYYYDLAEKLQVTKLWLQGKSMQNVLFDICSITSRSELVDACRVLLGRLARSVEEGRKQQDSDPVDKALRYVSRHFREAITLKEVADQVYLNPAYFSTLFKQRTGKTFVEYWTDLRIEEAKKQLSYSNEKIAVIAEQTGFGNIRHFNRVFKNVTGSTPNDYREQARSVRQD